MPLAGTAEGIPQDASASVPVHNISEPIVSKPFSPSKLKIKIIYYSIISLYAISRTSTATNEITSTILQVGDEGTGPAFVNIGTLA